MVVMKVIVMAMKVMVALNITEGITPQGGLSQRAPGRGYHRGQEDAGSIGRSRAVDSFSSVDWAAQQVADGRLAEVACSYGESVDWLPRAPHGTGRRRDGQQALGARGGTGGGVGGGRGSAAGVVTAAAAATTAAAAGSGQAAGGAAAGGR